MPKLKRVPPTATILKESALCAAQAVLQRAMGEAGLDIAEVGRRMNYEGAHFLMCGGSQMNIKRFAHALAVCGFRPTFGYAKVMASWATGMVELEGVMKPLGPSEEIAT